MYPESSSQDDSFPVIGVLPDTTNYYGFLCYGVGDYFYPRLIIFDKDGNFVLSQSAHSNSFLGEHEEINITHQSNTISISNSERGLEIIYYVFIKGKRFREFESNINNTNLKDSLFCQRVVQSGIINKNGNIVLDKPAKEDCRE